MLVIFDLDETLVHTDAFGSTEEYTRDPDFFIFKNYPVYVRRGVRQIFEWLRDHGIDIGIWSSGTANYIDAVLEHIVPDDIKISIKLSRTDCGRRKVDHGEIGGYYDRPSKDLSKVEALGYNLNEVLMIEDNPDWLDKHPDNVIRIKPYDVNDEDNELWLIIYYIGMLLETDNVVKANVLQGRRMRLNG